MKQFSLLTAFLCAVSMLTAQVQLPAKYVAREGTASAALKQELAAQRSLIVTQKLDYMVGNTSVSGKPISSITGELSVVPDVAKIQAKNQRMNERLKTLPLPEDVIIQASPCATQSKYDARNANLITPIRNQMCGNCWAFGAVGAYEANYLKVNGGSPNSLDLSEQHAQTCSGGGSCAGGFAYHVFEWMADQGKDLKTEAQLPQTGNNAACGGNVDNQYDAVDWGVVHPSGDINKIASVADIKKAICEYGAVSASVNVTGSFQNYTNGVYSGTPSDYNNPSTNHAIVLVGWDDTKGAWLLKNSWGSANWGEDGYMWIKYGSNNVGRRAAWIRAKKNCSRFAGTWKNIDPNTKGVTKIIAETTGAASIRTYGQCSPVDCDWGTSAAFSLPSIYPYEYYVSYNDAAAKRYMYFDLDCTDTYLTVKLVSNYHDNRPTRTDTYKFKK